MKAIYNSRTTEEENIQIKTDNRGFCYGDGLFETIVTGPHRINLVERHIDRLKRHASILAIELNDTFCTSLANEIEELKNDNQITKDCRTKVTIWRKPGGLYGSKQTDFDYIITQKETEKPVIAFKNEIGISSKVKNHYSSHSCIKSLNALDYVIAGNEMIERELDELIILDQEGNLSETHIGNLFWVKDREIYTPSLSTGCIDGIMRNFIIEFFKNQLMAVNILEAKAYELEFADSIISTNASGLTYFKRLEGRNNELCTSEENFEELIKRLQQP